MNNDYKPENENGGQTPGVNSDNQQYSYRSDNQNGGYTQNQNTGAQNGGYNAPGGGYGDQNRYYGQNQYGNQTGYGYQQNQYGYPGYVDESGIFSENKMKRLNGVSAKITIGDWLKTDCISLLNFIPFFGSIAALVLYCMLKDCGIDQVKISGKSYLGRNIDRGVRCADNHSHRARCIDQRCVRKHQGQLLTHTGQK